MTPPIVPCEWTSEFKEEKPDGETWALEIEHDMMKIGDPFVVVLDFSVFEPDKPMNEGLIAVSPAKAREMATALLVYAYFAEKDNVRMQSYEKQKREIQ